ncbi:cytidylyltransferase domain-containing protein [uncultured Desulfobacter sp.]|uniref:cytidylyltransferase domain-containing protein n=1 Tax=uncultured Desulfobacter sp. TaxID=240139 RepID=UPI002AA6250F|nr:hypothetical protein [uncultured Desulfobacter sp.]
MEDFGICIQARMSSTRLPGKVLKNFCGKPMLQFQVELLKSYKLCNSIVVLTSHNPADDLLEKFCIDNNIELLRGSEENVFKRYQYAAEKKGFEHIVRITGDNPLTHYHLLDSCMKVHLEKQPDLTSTRKILPDRSIQRFAPKGNSVDIIKSATLLEIDSNLLDDFEKEHVIPVFYNGMYRVEYEKQFTNIEKSISVDTIDDYNKLIEYAENNPELSNLKSGYYRR